LIGGVEQHDPEALSVEVAGDRPRDLAPRGREVGQLTVDRLGDLRQRHVLGPVARLVDEHETVHRHVTS
jgi:hypothetical protein